MEKINDILKNFTFSEAESELYTAALKLGKAGISEIAEKAGMGRTVAYFHIKNLLEKKVLKQIKKGNKMLISPISPTELAERLQNEVGAFKSLVPQLEAMSEIENEIPQISIEESNSAFLKIYDEISNMPIGSEFKVIEDQKGVEAELKLLDNKQWQNFFAQIAKRNILTKAIFTEELMVSAKKSLTPQNYNLVKKRMWNIRTLPESSLPIHNLIILYNHKISFLFPEISLTITIKHRELFKLIDTLFETVFMFAKNSSDPWGIDI